MKTRRIIGVLTAVLLLTACDPSYREDVVIHNGSSYTVTVIPSAYSYYNEFVDSVITCENKSYSLAPDEDVSVNVGGGIGGASRGEGVYVMNRYFGDSVVLLFDGGRKVVYHESDTLGVSPYNYESDCYSYEEQLNSDSWTFKDNPRYDKFTFTISDTHYEAASK